MGEKRRQRDEQVHKFVSAQGETCAPHKHAVPLKNTHAT